MHRPINAEERALWRKVIATVRPLEGRPPQPPEQKPEAPASLAPPIASRPAEKRPPAKARPGTTLDSTWDRRLARGAIAPDLIVDLHGHSLASAYDLLDRRLEQAIAAGDRLVLLITGKAPTDDRRPVARGAIRAAVGDWLAASRHARSIAAVRNAHPRHGGTGALYIILRRARP